VGVIVGAFWFWFDASESPCGKIVNVNTTPAKTPKIMSSNLFLDITPTLATVRNRINCFSNLLPVHPYWQMTEGDNIGPRGAVAFGEDRSFSDDFGPRLAENEPHPL